MKTRTRRELGIVLGDLIGRVLRSPLDLESAERMAQSCGYSRFHLTRVFQSMTGESLGHFLRRIRLERSASRLSEGASVLQASESAGFESPEAYSRAFRRAYGLSPSEFAPSGTDWKLPSEEGLHWIPAWEPDGDDRSVRLRFEARLDRTAALRLAVVRHTGNYAKLWLGWETVPFVEGRRWVTVYYDSIWTCPNSDLMRADLGYVIEDGEAPGTGFRAIEIPGGLTVKTSRFVERDQRHEAWTHMYGRWPGAAWSWDEYESWPLPFDEVKTRICLALSEHDGRASAQEGPTLVGPRRTGDDGQQRRIGAS